MSIPSKRFTVSGEETNMSVTAIADLKDTFIRNNPNAEITEISEDLESFIEDSMAEVPSEFDAAIDQAIRSTKDLIADIKDANLLDVKEMDKRIQKFFPNDPIARSVFTQLSDKCKKEPLSTDGLGKPYNPSVACNGRKTNTRNNDCNAGKYGDILNKLTGGAYASTYEDLNEKLKKIIALASFGYKMNMCGVFNAVTSDAVSKPMLSRASAGLLGMLSRTGNTLGALDVIGGSAGLSPLRELPGAIPMTFSAFQMPFGMKEIDMPDMSDRVTGAAEILDSEFCKKGTVLSISEYGDFNQELSTVMDTRRMALSIDEDSLGTIPDSDHLFLSAAYSALA
jgi:hypothetical protein